MSPVVFLFALVTASPPHGEALRYFKMRRYVEAEQRYAVILAANPKDIVAQLGVADSIVKQGDWERAARSYQEFVDAATALQAAERAKWKGDIARASNAIGVVALDHGRALEAVEAFERAVQDEPTTGLFRANLVAAQAMVDAAPLEQAKVSRHLATVKENDPAFALASFWMTRWKPLRGATVADASVWRVSECRGVGEPRTARMGEVIREMLSDQAKSLVAVIASFVVCERDTIEIDAVVKGAGRGAKRFAISASAMNWGEVRAAIGRIVDRAKTAQGSP